MPAKIHSAQNNFVLAHTLKGHEGPINCMAISYDSSMLISGCDEGLLMIWNLRTGELAQRIETNHHGAVSSLAWITLKQSSAFAFVVGSRDGTLKMCKRTEGPGMVFDITQVVNAHGDAVEEVAFDINNHRVASVGNGHPQVFNLSDDGVLTKLNGPSPTPREFHATNIEFYDEGRSLLVFYLESHEIVLYRIEPFEIIWAREVPTRIGCALMCRKTSTLFVCNLVNGIDAYQLPALNKIGSYPHAVARNFMLQLALFQTPNRDYIVVGGDSGCVRVFDRHSQQIADTLVHGAQSPGVLVQPVASNGSLIATGGSSPTDFNIKIWRSNAPRDDRFSLLEKAISWVGQKYVIIIVLIYGICQIAFISVFLFSWFVNAQPTSRIPSLFKSNPYMFKGFEDEPVPLD